ncbi:MAG: gamma-glutamylcyclotransferase [Rhodospirillaceae bacterium]|nr:gamma-glutamylcyclotransferase [Rhodospirillaceae bacterium]
MPGTSSGDDIPWPAGRPPVLDDAARIASRHATMKRRPAGPVWVFGYGSLIWNPGFAPAESRHALLAGYHRAFCFWTMSARGTPERPGLGLGLEAKAGANCRGIAMRIDPETEAQDLEMLWGREMYSGVYRPVWVTLTPTAHGPAENAPFTALTFIADPDHPQYCPPLSDAQKARIIAGAAGKFGPCADYLANVVTHLAASGEPDAELEALLEMVRELEG